MSNTITRKIWDIHDQIWDLQKNILQLHNQLWEEYYKERCPNHYKTFEEFVDAIALWNRGYFDNVIIDSFTNECKYGQNESTIPNILDIAEKYNFKDIGTVSCMICEACACQGCPCMETHLGHTCKDCRKSGYQMYEGYCDE